MPPAISQLTEGIKTRLSTSWNAGQQLESLSSIRGMDFTHRQHPPGQSRLWHRLARGLDLPTSDAIPLNITSSYTPYKPTVSLRANITSIIRPQTFTGSLSHPGINHISTVAIIYIAAGSCFVLLLGLAMILLLRYSCRRKGKSFPNLLGYYRQSRTDSSRKVLVEDDDDSTWGTPTRMVYIENASGLINGYQLQGSMVSLKKPPEMEISTWSASRQRSCSGLLITQPGEGKLENFREHSNIEERDIILALRDGLSPEIYSLADGGEKGPTFESLNAKGDGLIYGVSSSGLKNRPRQGSDASASSEETAEPDVTDFFSASTSNSSMTSLSSDSDIFDDNCDVYEVRRAQAHSVEIKKGVLMTWRQSSCAPPEIPGVPPATVVSEPFSTSNQESCPVIHTSDVPCVDMIGITTPSFSSLTCENSRGTLSSVATSFSVITQYGCYDDGFLLPPIPYLMVTCPSTSSIHTLDSAGSSVSIDLNNFPRPPLPVEGACSNPISPIHVKKRIWDNHPVNSTTTQKRSTVERFIMMYANV